ncbi:isochorismatase family protein [Formicincola oecophyllae]|uniref:nicotinamidase n=1 Tax=Formicincola oecophyllae TaxID=2558361 RepID=A0A4Y6UAB8_9PROT|nr:isochorismatase family protein [Formicincola oecophyllae]QDH13377.1 isochorismatase family protein [Formicincola oecophyllae]
MASPSSQSTCRKPTGKAFLVVDMQRDFLPGGTLALPTQHTATLAERLAEHIRQPAFNQHYDALVFTQDWHPANHASFQDQGGPWPAHCVAGTAGAKLASPLQALALPGAGGVPVIIQRKGTMQDCDSPSAFSDNGRQPSGLAAKLRSAGIKALDVTGVALEVCVKATVLDALKAGFVVRVLPNFCAGLDKAGATAALAALQRAGAHIEPG